MTRIVVWGIIYFSYDKEIVLVILEAPRFNKGCLSIRREFRGRF